MVGRAEKIGSSGEAVEISFFCCGVGGGSYMESLAAVRGSDLADDWNKWEAEGDIFYGLVDI